MERVAVGSSNPAKVAAVRRAFDELYPLDHRIVTAEADGGTEQPWSEAATRAGAVARARAALEAAGGDWGIGLEGGLAEDEAGLLVTSWIAAAHADGGVGLARTAGLYLSDPLAEQVRAGHELAEAWRRAQGIEGIGRADGTVGRLTGGRVDRARLYSEAVVLAATQVGPF